MDEAGNTQRRRLGQGCRPRFRFDALLLLFLIIGWSLIFASATLALRRSPEQWLRVQIVPRVSADYSVTENEGQKLEPVRAEIIEAVRRDALVTTPSQTSIALAKPTPSSILSRLRGPMPTPTFTPTVFQVRAGGPYTGIEGTAITLAATSTSRPDEAVVFSWDLNGDGRYDDAVGASTSYVFYENGEYRVGVQAIDPAGRAATDLTTIMVQNAPPKVDAGVDRTAYEGEQRSFSAVVTDPGQDDLFYYWDFGDGTPFVTDKNPEHTYFDNGKYTVRLRVEDDDGDFGESSFQISVSNLPPVADAGLDQVVDEGKAVTLAGSATDPGKLDTLIFEWDLDYEGGVFTPDAFGATVSAVYSDGPALVVAALRVRDPEGAEAMDTLAVQVNNVAPVIASVSDSSPVGEGSQVELVVTATDVPSDILSFDFDWDHDGTFEDPGRPGTVAYTWYNQGDYTVGIRVNDGDGGQVVANTTVSVYNVSPTAFAGTPVTGLEGSTITFSGSGSDPGMYDTLAYVWNFSDGGVITGATVSRVFPDNGDYTATLTVNDGDGGIGTHDVTAMVLNADPIVTLDASFEVKEGSELEIAAGVTDPGSADVVSLAWDLHYDGENFDEEVGDTPIVTPRYSDGPAERWVALRARDDDYPFPTPDENQDGQVIGLTRVTVRNVAPIAEAGGPYNGHPGQDIPLSGTAVDVQADMPSLAFAWDLDLNGTYEIMGPTVTGRWNTSGVYTVTLRVTDKDGDSGFDTARLNIANQPPTVDVGGPYTTTEGIMLTLTAVATDPDGDPLTYTWYVDPDQVFVTTVGSLDYAWPDDGTYMVTVQVDDGWGGTATGNTQVTVANADPVAFIIGSPYTTTVNVPLTLRGNGSDVPADTLTFDWDLDNDGVFETPGAEVTSVWTTTGIYTVVFRAQDEDGGSGTSTTTVDVSGLIPLAWPAIFYVLTRRTFRVMRRKGVE